MKRTAIALALLLLATPAGAATIADVQKTYDAGDFAAALSQVLPGATRVEPQGDATHGALLLAADLRLR